MNKAELERSLAALAFLAALIVTAMIAGILTTGISQEFFQSARAVAELSARITDNPASAFGLRLNLGLDNFLLVVYSAFFVLLAVRFRSAMDPWMAAIALGALLLTALLDAVENHHINMMLHSVEHMLPLTAEESRFQMVASAVKFHSSYFGLFLFAFGYCRQGKLGVWIAWLLWFGYLPLSILMSVIPVELAKPMALVRVCFFVLSFVLTGLLFLRSARAQIDVHSNAM